MHAERSSVRNSVILDDDLGALLGSDNELLCAQSVIGLPTVDFVSGKKSRFVVTIETMAKRLYLEGGGELIRAFRSSESGMNSPSAAHQVRSYGGWRCSACGHCFSAEQLRDNLQAR